ncbi:MAG: DUF3391 domain-containing protein [Burkholderiaceae bacterium]|nr:DUF3391 domain-containing protein [Burkholderiaceae bacterium]
MSNVPEPNLYPWIGVSDLRVGMFIHLNLSWLEHPFPLGSFRIATPAQIETLRGLGLQQVRYDPVKSSLDNPHGGLELVPPVAPPPLEPLPAGAATQAAPPSVPVAPLHEQQWQEQERKLAVCDQQFSQASLQYQKVAGAVEKDPASARAVGQALVSDCVSGLLNNGESAIRLLSEGLGGRNALHSVNVMVISLLLGRALGMAEAQLQDLGLAALLHDLGMVRLPVHLRQSSSKWTIADKALYRSHVDESVVLAQRMGLSEAVLTAIAQHHEMADGSGFPLHLFGDNLSQAGRILALVNHYDRMCNPSSGVTPLTPHEALSVIFAQLKPRFDPVTLGAFIRMMGVYPPGSIVELLNERYAIVVSVNSARPLRPKVIVHDPAVPKEQALIVDLETVPGLGIRRSIKPSQLAPDALEYLSPRQRICYFFEKVDGAGDHSAT